MSQDLPPLQYADPKAGYLAAKAEIDAAVSRVLASGIYINGPEVAAFEREFAAFLGATGAVGVANGTDAIELALRALGIGAGDQVVTVANTVTATVAAIVATGAVPVYVDVEPETMLIDGQALKAALQRDHARRIKAVIPVHLYGQACDMPSLMELVRGYGMQVIEDCAQAHGATVGGRLAGTWGDLATFSFYPTKNLGAFGDGGAVVGGNVAALERVRRLRQYGWRTRYISEEHGRNSRLDEMQAAVLRARLPRLEMENARRAELAKQLSRALADGGLRLPSVAPGRTHVWHQFVVRTPRRDMLKQALEKQGVICGVLYPTPIHRQPAYAVSEIALPHTERACAEVLSLPLHPGLTEADIARIAAAVLASR